MGDEYIKSITRWESLFDIKTWWKGESTELEKWLGTGFFKTLFVSKNGVVTVYYDKQEGEEFYTKLKEKLTQEFFDKLCDNFLELTQQINNVNSNKEIYNLMVKMWPALTIFDQISKSPDLASQTILNRLIRIRKNTESLSYDLMKKVKIENQPKDFIVMNGKLYL
tara:strand:+ start:114 stop:611 length:498 start_codon:yes stop_codon:yes gene_type:complete